MYKADEQSMAKSWKSTQRSWKVSWQRYEHCDGTKAVRSLEVCVVWCASWRSHKKVIKLISWKSTGSKEDCGELRAHNRKVPLLQFVRWKWWKLWDLNPRRDQTCVNGSKWNRRWKKRTLHINFLYERWQGKMHEARENVDVPQKKNTEIWATYVSMPFNSREMIHQ